MRTQCPEPLDDGASDLVSLAQIRGIENTYLIIPPFELWVFFLVVRWDLFVMDYIFSQLFKNGNG